MEKNRININNVMSTYNLMMMNGNKKAIPKTHKKVTFLVVTYNFRKFPPRF